jgi:PBSX family phage terminase large subunit
MGLNKLSAKQVQAIKQGRDSRVCIYEGSVRSGKTWTSLIAFADFLKTAPDGLIIMVGKTERTLATNVLLPMIEIFGTSQIKVTLGAGEAIIFGRTVRLIGADNAIAETKIRGLTLAGAYVDELTIIGGPKGLDFFQMLLTRMSVKGSRIIATTNPDSPQHWLLKDYLDKSCLVIEQDGLIETFPEHNAMGFHRYRFVIDDNNSLDPLYLDSIKNSYTGLFYDRFILGHWVAADGAIYPMLGGNMDGKYIIPDELIPRYSNAPYMNMKEWVLGIDHGSTNPTHCILLGLDNLGKVWAVRELRLTNKMATISAQARSIYEWLQAGCDGALQPNPQNPNIVRIVVDPAAKELRTQFAADGWGLPLPANNKVLDGIKSLGSAIDKGTLQFSPKCKELLKEMTGYVWDPKATARGEDSPVKKDDHGPDALRYAWMHLAPTWRKLYPMQEPRTDRIFSN